MTRTYTFEENLHRALMMVRHMATDGECARETALVITKLEEAVLWNDRRRVLRGLPALGLEWRP